MEHILYQYCGWLQERVKLFHAFHNAIHLHYKAARTVTEREFVFLYAIIDSKSHSFSTIHYENRPMFYTDLKFFSRKLLIFFLFLLKT